ncbi:hypothetical protein [Shouchella clausii]|uniref:hypothetical protein n=1 Tax=Shouchella clausii TaxID=79880 RepID=UPI00226D2203|nr:hypothetical protein [Shouchella clausii]MCY1105836.1 hypothetical protein [Shouchella clausii]
MEKLTLERLKRDMLHSEWNGINVKYILGSEIIAGNYIFIGTEDERDAYLEKLSLLVEEYGAETLGSELNEYVGLNDTLHVLNPDIKFNLAGFKIAPFKREGKYGVELLFNVIK